MTDLSNWPTVTDDSGTKQDGTIFNEALSDAMKSAIEDVVNSATNPTETPADIIDEVVIARGDMASLDERLDVSMNDDGTMKANAANFSTENYQVGLGSRNVVKNGDMFNWTLGSALAPDEWTLNGAAATVAQCGPTMGDTTSLGAGTYCALLTRVGNDCNLSQDVVAAADIADFTQMRERKVALAAVVKCSTANVARLQLDDGVGTADSSYHTGAGTEELLSAVLTISATATKLTSLLRVQNTNVGAYFSGVAVVFAEVAPTTWQPLSREVYATATKSGLVSAVAQSIGGVKSFEQTPLWKPGGASSVAATGVGSVSVQTTNTGNVNAGEDVLFTYTVPANTMDMNGASAIRITAGWTSAANANNKQVRIYFGTPGAGALTTAMTTSTVAAHNAETGVATIILTRSSNTAQRSISNLRWGTTDSLIQTAGPTETLSGDTQITVTGEATATNDILGRFLIIETLGS